MRDRACRASRWTSTRSSLKARCLREGTNTKLAQRLLVEYRRFLELKIALNDFGEVDGEVEDILVSPSRQIDELWHMHILDTRTRKSP